MTEIVPVPAVNGAIFNAEGKLLLTRRSPRVRAPGFWVLPGGHVDPGETWVQAVRREVREEVGLEVLSEELIGVYSDPSVTITEERISAGFFAQYVVVLFRILDFRGDVVPNEEVDGWGWFDPGELPQPLLKSHPVRIQDAFAGGGGYFR